MEAYTVKRTALTLSILLLTLSACTSQKFDGPAKVGGKWVDSATLNLGHDTYANYCMQCHGMNGDGNGPAAQGMVPAPRNFQQGAFKFGNVAGGELPSDEDLRRIIRYGLNGTQMLPWDISDARLDAVIHYIKTFSPEWREKSAGETVELGEDPWGTAKASEAIAQGKRMYHGIAQCFTCHPAYATPEEVAQISKEVTGTAVELRPDAQISILQGSSYFTPHEGKEAKHSFMPPDFTRHRIKSGDSLKNIAMRLAIGINGTTMPAWKGMLSLTGDEAEDNANLWALAHYVKSLQDLRWDDKARAEFMAELSSRRNVDMSN
jgi:mono/diheme cytochrome c family protein